MVYHARTVPEDELKEVCNKAFNMLRLSPSKTSDVDELHVLIFDILFNLMFLIFEGITLFSLHVSRNADVADRPQHPLQRCLSSCHLMNSPP